ncbi:hypothetical protein [Amycolatopsis sp. 195334CR]|uniref:hypothetical protein n=1 Tax=Amycolatopsis sp. 195334CR TaxID=2814588 RepID=UPI001A8E35EC|nr:hypothetical protein [Amycolatopsis sp. 195334CR]MBN6041645.1 hypothetical protein [Amycolatopsis sp. 195334CR]
MPEQFTRPLLVLGTSSRRRRDPEPAGGRANDREDRLSRALHSLAIQVRQLRR